MSSEAEAVFQDPSDLSFSGFVRDIIQIALGIGVVEIDRRGNDLMGQRLQTDDEFDPSRGSEQMTHLTLGA